MTKPAPPSRRRRIAAAFATVAVALTVPSVAIAKTGDVEGHGNKPTPQRPAADSATGTDAGVDGFPLALLIAIFDPEMSPPGANDWNCKPSAAHPDPVILIHGSLENAYDNWSGLSPVLANHGYCVFAPNLGAAPGALFKATGHIPDTAQQLATYVDAVLAKTGARQVDLVGHSQGGGVLARWYLKYDGGADAAHPTRDKVRRLIGISPSNHGTTVLGTSPLLTATHATDLVNALVGPSIPEQLDGSEINRTLDAGGDTMPGVEYTTIVTAYDEVLTPPARQFLAAGPGATVRNILLQSYCPQDLADHVATAYDANAMQFVLGALESRLTPPLDCELVLPVLS